IVELAPTEQVFAAATHPYTQALLKELPVLSTTKRQFDPIVGELPSPADPPPGCAFHPRCPRVMARCRVERPPLRQVAPGHSSPGRLSDEPGAGTQPGRIGAAASAAPDDRNATENP